MKQGEKWEKKKKLLQLSKVNLNNVFITRFYPSFLSWELQFFLINRELMQIMRVARFTLFMQKAASLYANMGRWRRKAINNVLNAQNFARKWNVGVTRSTINFYRFFISGGYKYNLNLGVYYRRAPSLLQRMFLDKSVLDVLWWRGVHKFFYLPYNAQRTSRLKRYFHEYWGSRFGQVPFEANSKLYFLNYHKPLIWKMRSARIAYWGVYKTGRLNRRRFRKLAKTLVHFSASSKFNYRNLFVWLVQLQLVASWRHLAFLLKHNLITVNGSYNYCPSFYTVGTIIESLSGPFLFWMGGLLKRFFWGMMRKMKVWAYRQYLHTQCYYLTKPKTTPKFLTQIVINSTQIYSVFECDLSIGAIVLIQPFLKQQQLVPEIITNSTMLKLTTWRFRFM